MKIVIDARYLEGTGGGVGKYIKELIVRAPKTYQFICISTKPLNTHFKNVETIVLPNKFHWFFWEQIQLPIKLSQLKPDIYHAAANYGIPLFSPVKTILTVHDIIPITTPNYFAMSRISAISKILFYLRTQVSLVVANKIIVTNDLLAKQLSTNFYLNSHKITIIPMGISDIQIKPNESKK